MFDWVKSFGRKAVDRTRTMAMTFVPQAVANQQWIMDSLFRPLTTEGYKRNAVVYSCVRVISQSLCEPPLHFTKPTMKDDEKEVKVDDWVEDLLLYPNEQMTQFEMIEMIGTHLSICGLSCWWKERANNGRIKSLWPLRPDRISPYYSNSTKDGERVISGWVYHTPGSLEVIILPQADILFINFPDPLGESGGMVEGLGPLQVLAREVSSDNEATKYIGSILANYAQPGWAITIKAAVQSETEARLLKMKFQSEFGGAHRGEPAILDADTTLTKMSFSMQELEMPELRSITESRIAAAFGVPAILVGLKVGLDHATYSNIAEARKDFTERTLELWWRRIEDVLNRDLMQELAPKVRVSFDRSKVQALHETRMSLIEPIRTAWGSNAATLDEYRTAIGLKPDKERGKMYKLMADIVLETNANALVAPPQQPGADQDQLPPGADQGQLPPGQQPAQLPPGQPPVDPDDPYGLFAGAAKALKPGDTDPDRIADEARRLYEKEADNINPALERALAKQGLTAAIRFADAMKETNGAAPAP